MTFSEKQHPKEKQSDFIFRVLKHKIVAFELKPDEKISENYLSNIFNMSRPSVREALSALEKERLVIIKPQQGTFITKINLREIKDFLFMRIAIENAVMKELIAQFSEEFLHKLQANVYYQQQITNYSPELFLKVDDDFHRVLYKAAKKEDIWNTLGSLSISYDRLTYLLLINEPQFYDKFVHHHVMTLEILENKNKEAIEDLFNDHVGSIFPQFFNTINKYEKYIEFENDIS